MSINLDGIDDAQKAINDVFNSIKQATSQVNKAFEEAQKTAENPHEVAAMQAQVQRLLTKAMRGGDVSAEINKLISNAKNIR